MRTPSHMVQCALLGRLRPGAGLVAVAVAGAFVAMPMAVSAQVVASGDWISFDGVTSEPAQPALEIVSSDLSELRIDVRTPGLVSDGVRHDGTDFRRLSFPGCYHTTEVGYPCIPTVNQLIAVPAGCEVEVSVSLGDSIVYEGMPVYPVEAPVTRYTEDGWPYIAYEFSKDEDAYESTGYYPGDVATVSSLGSLRGQGVALLTLHPVQYEAATARLRVFPSLVVRVTFSGGAGSLAEPLGPLGAMAREVLLCYEGIATRQRGRSGGGNHGVCRSVEECAQLNADYLMIVENSIWNSAWVDTLAVHRAAWNGWNVAVVPDSAVIDNYQGTSEISDEAIKEFIQDVYETRTAEHMDDGRLGYVLLVGDARRDQANALLPAHGVTPPTDHWYACVDYMDDYADLMIGRLCAGDTTELAREVQKYVNYERAADATAAWRDDVLLASGYAWIGGGECGEEDSTGYVASAEASFDSVRAVLPGGYYVEEIHAHELPLPTCFEQHRALAALMVDRLNEGALMTEIAAHGGPLECWGFTSAHVDSIDNADSLTFWMSMSCRTGAFDYCSEGVPTDCLGERLLHGNGLNGAVAFFGPTTDSYAAALENLAPYLWQSFLRYDMHTLGEAIAFAKLKHFSVTGRNGEVLQFNLLGDPALNPFLTSTGDRPDYVVTQSGVRTSPECPSVGQPALLRAVVRNNSCHSPMSPVAVSLQLCERDGTGCALPDTVWVHPTAWSADTASVAWNIGQADVGQWLLKVTVDPGNEQSELFEDNNSAESFVGAYFQRAGFPVALGGACGFSPTIANIDADPELEILACVRSPGEAVLCSCEGQRGPSFHAPSDVALRGPAAIADLDFDGDQEVVLCYGDSVLALNAQSLTPAWTSPYHAMGLFTGPSVGDARAGDGELEVVVQGRLGLHSRTHVVSAAGSLSCVSSTAFQSSATGLGFPEKIPTMADVDSDGLVDVVSALPNIYPTLRVRALSAAQGDTCTVLWENILGLPSGMLPANPVVAEMVGSSPGVEVVCSSDSTIVCLSSTGATKWTSHVRGHLSGIAIHDLDGEDGLEILAATYGTGPDPDSYVGRIYVVSADGAVVDSISCEYAPRGAPVVADLDGDSRYEIIVASSYWCLGPPTVSASHLEILTFDPAAGLEFFFDRPLFFPGEVTSTPAVADADLDGCLEIFLVDAVGRLHCLEYWEQGVQSRWSSLQHDERHTGAYETPVKGALADSSAVSWWGDYLLEDDARIPAASSLLVQPGTTIRVAPPAPVREEVLPPWTWLNVEGELVAGGDPLHVVRFISESETPGHEDWNGIKLNPGSKGLFSDALISNSAFGIYASDPAELRVEDCTFIEHSTKAIRCTGDAGQSSVSILGNVISDAPIGVELRACSATVEGNTIEECSAHAIKIYSDRGSRVRSNAVTVPVPNQTFSGIYVHGSQSDLVVAGNTIGDALHGIPNVGIKYESSDALDAGILKDNEIIASAETKSTGFSFYEASPLVRANTLSGKSFSTAFFVAGSGTARPDLGQADGDSCTSCADTTLSGCNRVVPDDPADWYVWVSYGYPPTAVHAECNYWDPAPTGEKFHGNVIWEPYLDHDPGIKRGGLADETLDVPGAFVFRQNVPNPFNPTTVFRFGLPERSPVRLDVYDLAGRHVRSLLGGAERGAGWHETTWDGRNDLGQRVASGIYLCRLTIGNRQMSRKAVLLK